MMKKEKRLLRVGVLGCGPISQAAHFEASLKARNAELYAICDRAKDLVEKIAARFEPRKTFFWAVQFVPCERPLRKSSTVSAG